MQQLPEVMQPPEVMQWLSQDQAIQTSIRLSGISAPPHLHLVDVRQQGLHVGCRCRRTTRPCRKLALRLVPAAVQLRLPARAGTFDVDVVEQRLLQRGNHARKEHAQPRHIGTAQKGGTAGGLVGEMGACLTAAQ